jgi:hypothetical protein
VGLKGHAVGRLPTWHTLRTGITRSLLRKVTYSAPSARHGWILQLRHGSQAAAPIQAPQVGGGAPASASRLLGLGGFEVLAAEVVGGEWHEPACGVRTWTERVAAIGPRAVLTQRARAEACRRVGKDAHAVAAVARALGVGWATVMRAVGDHGTPLVDDAARLEGVVALGLDETSFLKATRLTPTRWVTGLVDLERGRLLDLVIDRTRAAVDGWLHARPRALAGPDRHGRAGPLALLCQRPDGPTRSCDGGGGPLPRHPAGQHGGRPGPPADPAGHPGASGP